MAIEITIDSPAFSDIIDFIVGHKHSLKLRYSQYKLKPSYLIVYWYVVNLLILYGRPPSTIDTVSATIFDGRRVILAAIFDGG